MHCPGHDIGDLCAARDRLRAEGTAGKMRIGIGSGGTTTVLSGPAPQSPAAPLPPTSSAKKAAPFPPAGQSGKATIKALTGNEAITLDIAAATVFGGAGDTIGSGTAGPTLTIIDLSLGGSSAAFVDENNADGSATAATASVFGFRSGSSSLLSMPPTSSAATSNTRSQVP
jgi:hypothetical protein